VHLSIAEHSAKLRIHLRTFRALHPHYVLIRIAGIRHRLALQKEARSKNTPAVKELIGLARSKHTPAVKEPIERISQDTRHENLSKGVNGVAHLQM